MKPAHHAVGPNWPPALEAYDYLSSLIWRDWAWESLRRNPSYQAQALAHAATADISEHLEGASHADAGARLSCSRVGALHLSPIRR